MNSLGTDLGVVNMSGSTNVTFFWTGKEDRPLTSSLEPLNAMMVAVVAGLYSLGDPQLLMTLIFFLKLSCNGRFLAFWAGFKNVVCVATPEAAMKVQREEACISGGGTNRCITCGLYCLLSPDDGFC